MIAQELELLYFSCLNYDKENNIAKFKNLKQLRFKIWSFTMD